MLAQYRQNAVALLAELSRFAITPDYARMPEFANELARQAARVVNAGFVPKEIPAVFHLQETTKGPVPVLGEPDVFHFRPANGNPTDHDAFFEFISSRFKVMPIEVVRCYYDELSDQRKDSFRRAWWIHNGEDFQ